MEHEPSLETLLTDPAYRSVLEQFSPIDRLDPRFWVWYESLQLSLFERLANGETFVFLDEAGDEHPPVTFDALMERANPGNPGFGDVQLWSDFELLVYGIAHYREFDLMHSLLLVQWGIHQPDRLPWFMDQEEKLAPDIPRLLLQILDGAKVLFEDIFTKQTDPMDPRTRLRLSRGPWNAAPDMSWTITRQDLSAFVERNYPDDKDQFEEFIRTLASYGPQKGDKSAMQQRHQHSRQTLLKLVLGMAMAGYGYDPSKPNSARQKATGEGSGSIHAALLLKDLPMDDETVRAILREAVATTKR